MVHIGRLPKRPVVATMFRHGYDACEPKTIVQARDALVDRLDFVSFGLLRMPRSRTAVYNGPVDELRGERCMTMSVPGTPYVLAQFNNVATGLGHGWHAIPIRHLQTTRHEWPSHGPHRNAMTSTQRERREERRAAMGARKLRAGLMPVSK